MTEDTLFWKSLVFLICKCKNSFFFIASRATRRLLLFSLPFKQTDRVAVYAKTQQVTNYWCLGYKKQTKNRECVEQALQFPCTIHCQNVKCTIACFALQLCRKINKSCSLWESVSPLWLQFISAVLWIEHRGCSWIAPLSHATQVHWSHCAHPVVVPAQVCKFIYMPTIWCSANNYAKVPLFGARRYRCQYQVLSTSLLPISHRLVWWHDWYQSMALCNFTLNYCTGQCGVLLVCTTKNNPNLPHKQLDETFRFQAQQQHNSRSSSPGGSGSDNHLCSRSWWGNRKCQPIHWLGWAAAVWCSWSGGHNVGFSGATEHAQLPKACFINRNSKKNYFNSQWSNVKVSALILEGCGWVTPNTGPRRVPIASPLGTQ